MNIYQKKIVKEKEFILNDICTQTKSTNLNSMPDIDSDIKSNINIRQFYGINTKKSEKSDKISKNNRQNRSKSLIMTKEDMIEKYIPKEIKTVLIKFKKPLEQNNNNNNLEQLKNKTYYTNKFYTTKNTNNEFKKIEYSPIINNRQNIIKFEPLHHNINNYNNYNTNLFSLYAQRQNNHKNHKFTRNKSVIIENKDMKSDNISMNTSFNTIYKKSYCLDKHKNYGGNFKNKDKGKDKDKDRSQTNSYIKQNENCNQKNKDNNLIIKNISAPNIFNIAKVQNSIGTNFFDNENIENKINNIHIKYNNINSIVNKNENLGKENWINVELCKNNEELKNKLKIKNIHPLKFKNNIQNSSNVVDFDSNDTLYKGLLNKNRYIKYNDMKQISLNKYKNYNILTFEEPMNDKYSMKNKIKSNLINIISISEQDTKREERNNNKSNQKICKMNNDINKFDNNKIKTKIKKDNHKKINTQNYKTKSKGKAFRTTSIKKMESENNPYNININDNNMSKIKSIPLKIKNSNDIYLCSQNYYNKDINISKNIGYNILYNNKVNTNVILINDKDYNLWNDLTRIYNKNSKY